MAKPGKARKQAARNQRLSAALRENLKRRRMQARGRAAERPAEGGGGDPADNTGIKTPDFRRNHGNE